MQQATLRQWFRKIVIIIMGKKKKNSNETKLKPWILILWLFSTLCIVCCVRVEMTLDDRKLTVYRESLRNYSVFDGQNKVILFCAKPLHEQSLRFVWDEWEKKTLDTGRQKNNQRWRRRWQWMNGGRTH